MKLSLLATLLACLLLFAPAIPAAAGTERPLIVAQVDSSKLLVQPRPEQKAEPGFWTNITTYIRVQQQKFYRQLAGAIKAVKAENSLAAAWSLVLLSFLYGVFHAAGPGHGKAVISAYLLADERLLRRGVVLAFISAFLQAVSAIVLVTGTVLIFAAAGRTARSMVTYLESASYALICVIGVYMLWSALRGGHSHAHAHAHDGDADGHEHHDGCGHAHIPEARQLGENWSLRKAASIAFAVGIRPCSGAVLVLLFANTLGLYVAGVGATFAMSLGTAITVSVIAIATVLSKNLATSFLGPDSVWAGRLYRGLAVVGAVAIFAIGLVLLTGSLQQGRPLI
ncbi:MAG: nickel/cobalt transporter [Hyphomicrobiales bacterium]